MFAVAILSIGLAMDAVAVALVRGATGERRVAHGFELALAFGVAQGVMPLIGWSLGTAFAGTIEAFDHWVAFALLAFLGARMLKEAVSDDDGPAPGGTSFRLAALVTAAIATSIDAAAAGLALPLLEVRVLTACAVIGAVTAVLSGIGYWLGSRASPRLGKWAELLGGVVLIGLGVRILVEHLAV